MGQGVPQARHSTTEQLLSCIPARQMVDMQKNLFWLELTSWCFLLGVSGSSPLTAPGKHIPKSGLPHPWPVLLVQWYSIPKETLPGSPQIPWIMKSTKSPSGAAVTYLKGKCIISLHLRKPADITGRHFQSHQGGLSPSTCGLGIHDVQICRSWAHR